MFLPAARSGAEELRPVCQPLEGVRGVSARQAAVDGRPLHQPGRRADRGRHGQVVRGVSEWNRRGSRGGLEGA
eukprot:632358-Pyramimonas_sp.AAC.2